MDARRVDAARVVKYAHELPAVVRSDAEAWTIGYFKERYDPYWRAVLIENLLRLMRDRPAVGIAAADASGLRGFAEDQYVHGNVARGLIGAGVNELAMHCEDLFSVIRAAHRADGFALGVVNYDAGKAAGLAAKITRADDAWIRKALLVPDPETVAAGLVGAPDAEAAVAAAEAGAARTVEWCRDAAKWYGSHEASHLRYKHGLRLLLGGFGTLSRELIDARRTSTSASLITLTNAPVTKADAGVTFEFTDRLRRHLSALLERRLLLRVRFTRDVDLIDLAAMAWKIAALQACVLTNRAALAEGTTPPDQYVFQVPHAEIRMSQSVLLHVDQPPKMENFRLRL